MIRDAFPENPMETMYKMCISCYNSIARTLPPRRRPGANIMPKEI